MGKKLVVPGADFSANAIERSIPYALTQGYAAAGGTEQNPKVSCGILSTRVMTNQIYGSYTIKTNSGFAIRAIVVYTPFIESLNREGTNPVSSTATVPDVQGLTEYTLSNPGQWSIITFCKTDATQDLSPADDIVAELY